MEKRADRPYLYRVEGYTDEGRFVAIAEEKTPDRAHEALDVYIKRFDPKETMTYRILEVTVVHVIPSRLARKEQLRLLRKAEVEKKLSLRR